MKLFVLSLEEDAFDWFFGLQDDKFATINTLIDAFTERWGDKREHCHSLAALHTIKKYENETMEEFNKKFNDLIAILHRDIKPPYASILIYYIETFNGDMRYQPYACTKYAYQDK